MNTLFILQRKLICELYYISVYFLLLLLIIILNKKGGFKCYAVISRDVLGLCLPRNYLNLIWQEMQMLLACIRVK